MPDSDNNLTQAEIDVLKANLEQLKKAENSLANLERIGYDTTDDKKEIEKSRQDILTMLRVYEPLVKE